MTVTAYDANGNLLQVIGPADAGRQATGRRSIIEDAFRCGQTLTHTGDFVPGTTRMTVSIA